MFPLVTFPPRPNITSISPNLSVSTGGVAVTIQGQYMQGATAISFGGVALTSLSVSADGTSATGTTGTFAGLDGDYSAATITIGGETFTADKKFLYLPPSVLGLWDANLGVTLVSGKVSVWADQSGLGNDLKQPTAGSRPTVTANYKNGLPAITASGSQMFTSNITWGSGTGATVVYVGSDSLTTPTQTALYEYSVNANSNIGFFNAPATTAGDAAYQVQEYTSSPSPGINYGFLGDIGAVPRANVGVIAHQVDHTVSTGVFGHAGHRDRVAQSPNPVGTIACTGAFPTTSFNVFSRNGTTSPAAAVNHAWMVLGGTRWSDIACNNVALYLQAKFGTP